MQMQQAHTLAKADSPAAEQRPSTLMPFFGWLARTLRAHAEDRNHRRAMRELRRFDEHMLSDIGLSRAGIEQAVRHGRGALRI